MRAVREASLFPFQESPEIAMGYYTTSQYRGDFYRRPRGDFYGQRGDLWDDISGWAGAALSKVGGGIVGAIPGLSSLFSGGARQSPELSAAAPGAGNVAMLGPVSPFALPPAGVPGATSLGRFGTAGTGGIRLTGPANPTPAGRATIATSSRDLQRAMDGRDFSGTRRHMNVLNPKALRRSLRRANGFINFANSVLKVTKPGRHAVAFKTTPKKKQLKARIG